MAAIEHSTQDQYEHVDLTIDQWKQIIKKGEEYHWPEIVHVRLAVLG